MDVSLPGKGDKLFLPEEDYFEGAWIGNPGNKFFLYSEGYKKAAKVLFGFCEGNAFFNNTVVYPIIFLYRHFIELRLKELIVLGYQYLDIHEDFPNDHSLERLWNKYRSDIVGAVDNWDKDDLDNVERLLREFNQIDPKSFSFRYPVDTSPERNPSLSLETVDLKNFSEVMEKLIYFLDCQVLSLSSYLDLKNEMIADMMNDMYQDYYHE